MFYLYTFIKMNYTELDLKSIITLHYIKHIVNTERSTTEDWFS